MKLNVTRKLRAMGIDSSLADRVEKKILKERARKKRETHGNADAEMEAAEDWYSVYKDREHARTAPPAAPIENEQLRLPF